MAKTILIAEGDGLNRRLFTDMLESRGYRVLCAEDGLHALSLARAQAPDLIVLDIRLPGASGLDVARWLKEEAPLGAIPIILVSAYARLEDMDRVWECGCDAYLAKPISVSSFVATAESLLAKREISEP
jgi:two-component system cell cycle response regulator DivK